MYLILFGQPHYLIMAILRGTLKTRHLFLIEGTLLLLADDVIECLRDLKKNEKGLIYVVVMRGKNTGIGIWAATKTILEYLRYSCTSSFLWVRSITTGSVLYFCFFILIFLL
jgi:hypothetical protein